MIRPRPDRQASWSSTWSLTASLSYSPPVLHISPSTQFPLSEIAEPAYLNLDWLRAPLAASARPEISWVHAQVT